MNTANHVSHETESNGIAVCIIQNVLGLKVVFEFHSILATTEGKKEDKMFKELTVPFSRYNIKL